MPRKQIIKHRSQLVRNIVLTVILTTVSFAHAADDVRLKSTGKSVRGTISNVTRQSITVKIKVGNKSTVVPSSDIESVSWDGEPAGIKQTRSHEKSGLLDKALEGYKKAASSNKSSNLLVRADIQFLIARVLAKQAILNPKKQKEAISKLESFRKQYSTSFRYYESLSLLGDLYLSNKQYDKARPIFALIGQSTLPVHKMQAKSAEAKILLAEGKTDAALAIYNEILKMPGKEPLAKRQHFAAYLGKANCLQKTKKYAEAAKVFEDVAVKADEKDMVIKAEAWLRGGDALRLSGRNKEAVLAYLHVDLLCPKQPSMRAEALYQLSQLFNALGDSNNSARSSGKLTNDYPDSTWAKKLSGQ